MGKAIYRNDVAARMFNEEDATRVIWLRRADEPTVDQPRMFMAGCDYGPLARWVDDKRIELATTAGATRLAERLVSERDAAAEENFYESAHGNADIDPEADNQRALSASQLSLPRLLCGFYGGLFTAAEGRTGLGTFYSVK